MREQTQLRIILGILDEYKGKEPLSRFLKKYFNLNRQLGSRDRRLIQEFIYNYFRIGKMFPEKTGKERLAIANKICKAEPGPLLEYVSNGVPHLDRYASQIEPERLFPFGRHLSDSVSKAEFIHSFLRQPKIWIRVREEFIQEVEKEFREKEIYFEPDPGTGNSWSVRNATALDQLDSYRNGHFEVQDLSSQLTINYILPAPNELWWDACAGAGGKSLMMAAKEPSVQLFCTDSRETILQNLEKRFHRAGIKNAQVKVMDLESGSHAKRLPEFDGIVADVPCTGSGTWSRTPEWLTFFNPSFIEKFQARQRNIVSSVIRLLPDNKPFVYITCSVFKEENEENTSWMTSNLPLKLQTQLYLEGAAKGADTMFVARFLKV